MSSPPKPTSPSLSEILVPVLLKGFLPLIFGLTPCLSTLRQRKQGFPSFIVAG